MNLKKKKINLNINDKTSSKLNYNRKKNSASEAIIERIYSDKSNEESNIPKKKKNKNPPKIIEPQKKVITPIQPPSKKSSRKVTPEKKSTNNIDNNYNLFDPEDLVFLKKKIIDLEKKSAHIENVNHLLMKMLKNKVTPGGYYNPQMIPPQPYYYVNPQAPQIDYDFYSLGPTNYNEKILPPLNKSQSQPEFIPYRYNKFSNYFLKDATKSLKLLDQGLQGYFCNNILYF